MNDDHCNRNTCKILLVFEIAIDREQSVELARCQSKQLAILHAGPTHLGNRFDIVANKVREEHTRQATRASAIK